MQLSRKRFLLASLAAATSTALVACSGASDSGGTDDTRTITDHADKQVTLPATITRVAIDQWSEWFFSDSGDPVFWRRDRMRLCRE